MAAAEQRAAQRIAHAGALHHLPRLLAPLRTAAVVGQLRGRAHEVRFGLESAAREPTGRLPPATQLSAAASVAHQRLLKRAGDVLAQKGLDQAAQDALAQLLADVLPVSGQQRIGERDAQVVGPLHQHALGGAHLRDGRALGGLHGLALRLLVGARRVLAGGRNPLRFVGRHGPELQQLPLVLGDLLQRLGVGPGGGRTRALELPGQVGLDAGEVGGGAGQLAHLLDEALRAALEFLLLAQLAQQRIGEDVDAVALFLGDRAGQLLHTVVFDHRLLRHAEGVDLALQRRDLLFRGLDLLFLLSGQSAHSGSGSLRLLSGLFGTLAEGLEHVVDLVADVFAERVIHHLRQRRERPVRTLDGGLVARSGVLGAALNRVESADHIALASHLDSVEEGDGTAGQRLDGVIGRKCVLHQRAKARAQQLDRLERIGECDGHHPHDLRQGAGLLAAFFASIQPGREDLHALADGLNHEGENAGQTAVAHGDEQRLHVVQQVADGAVDRVHLVRHGAGEVDVADLLQVSLDLLSVLADRRGHALEGELHLVASGLRDDAELFQALELARGRVTYGLNELLDRPAGARGNVAVGNQRLARRVQPSRLQRGVGLDHLTDTERRLRSEVAKHPHLRGGAGLRAFERGHHCTQALELANGVEGGDCGHRQNGADRGPCICPTALRFSSTVAGSLHLLNASRHLGQRGLDLAVAGALQPDLQYVDARGHPAPPIRAPSPLPLVAGSVRLARCSASASSVALSMICSPRIRSASSTPANAASCCQPGRYSRSSAVQPS